MSCVSTYDFVSFAGSTWCTATPCFYFPIVCIRFHHRPIRHCRYGYDGVHIATAACCYRAVEKGSGHKTYSCFCSSVRHRKIYQWTWARGLLACGIFKPESQSIPREKFLHCSIRLLNSYRLINTRNCLGLLPTSNKPGLLALRLTKGF